jgi:hypothetical protein
MAVEIQNIMYNQILNEQIYFHNKIFVEIN